VPQTALIKTTERPLGTVSWLSGTSIRAETHCHAVVEQRGRALTPRTASALDVLDFVLRVAAESKEDFELGPASCIRYVANDGLPFISLSRSVSDAFSAGRLSYLACDRKTRQGMCPISQNLVTDERLFSQHLPPARISVLTECVETSS
jgi:hypothetical protein